MKTKVKTLYIIIFAILTLLTAAFDFYSTNLIMSDISNLFYGFQDFMFIASLPAFCLTILLILVLFFLIRIKLRPQYKKSMLKSYLITGSIISFIGLILSILSGTLIYKSFTKPYPFPGYVIIVLVLFIVSLACCVIGLTYVNKNIKDDKEKMHKSIKYILYTILLCVVVFFSLNRLGAVLLSPIFIQARTFYLTWPFYLWLLLPSVMLACILLNAFNVYPHGTKKSLISYVILFAISISLTVVCVILGKTNTLFISAVSPTVGLERLATMPVDTILQIIVLVAFNVFFIVKELLALIRNKKSK